MFNYKAIQGTWILIYIKRTVRYKKRAAKILTRIDNKNNLKPPKPTLPVGYWQFNHFKTGLITQGFLMGLL